MSKWFLGNNGTLLDLYNKHYFWIEKRETNLFFIFAHGRDKTDIIASFETRECAMNELRKILQILEGKENENRPLRLS
jgi:hypothetical protein